MLVAEHNLPMVVRRDNGLETVAAGLSVFRVDVDVGTQSMF